MAFKMNGSPAKLGMIKGTAGHSAAKMKKEAAMKMKSPMEKKLVGDQNNLPEELKAKIEASPTKQMDPKVVKTLKSFDRPTPGLKTKKPTKAQIKKILEKMKSIKGPGVQLSDDHKKTIEGVEKMIKDQKSPAKQKQQSSGSEKIQKQQTSKAGQLLRQKQIDAVDAKIETLEEQIFNEEITQEQYDEAMKSLRIKEKQVKKPL